MLLVVMLVGMVAVLFVFGIVDTTALVLRRDQDTAKVLAQAKQALIGRAVSDDNRPGSLPCPDFDDGSVNPLNVANDGVADLMTGNVCPSYIGRLPWKTLGLPDLRDDAGERLWYALSNNFRDDMSAGPLNSDTKGNRTVHSESTAVTLTSEAVAVIFAPGPVIAGQNRDPASANNPANYLDTTGGVNNAIAAGPFIRAQPSSTFNDKLLVITTADVIPVVEMRVARELRALLLAYWANSACGCYPWADRDTPWTGEGDDDALGGAPSLNPGDPEPWGSGSIPPLPAWLLNNQWWRVIYYAVDPSKTDYFPTGGTPLRFNGNPYDIVLIMTGPAGSGPLGNLRPSFAWAHYVDDILNSDGDNEFVTPLSTAYARDRLYTIP